MTRHERRNPDNPDTREDPSVERRSRMSEERKKLTFDPTINAGHLLTFAGFIIAIFVGWTTLDKRVVVLEEERKRQSQVDQHQDSIQQAQMSAVRESLAEIKQGIRELNTRFERKEARP